MGTALCLANTFYWSYSQQAVVHSAFLQWYTLWTCMSIQVPTFPKIIFSNLSKMHITSLYSTLWRLNIRMSICLVKHTNLILFKTESIGVILCNIMWYFPVSRCTRLVYNFAYLINWIYMSDVEACLNLDAKYTDPQVRLCCSPQQSS